MTKEWFYEFGKRLPSIVMAIVMSIPLLFVILSAISVESVVWGKLWQNRLPLLLQRSFLLVFTVTIGALGLGTVLAWLVERTDLPARRWIRPLLTAPLIIPCYIIAICYISFFGLKGLFEKGLHIFIPDIAVPNIYGFWGAVFILILGTYPYVYTIVSAGIRRLDPSLSEAAKCLGIGRWSRLIKITLPLLTPAFLASIALVALYVLSDFGVVSLLRYNTFVNAIYEQMSGRYNFKIASAFSLVLVMLTMIFLFIQEKSGAGKRYHTSSPRIGAYARVSLGALKIPVLVFIGFVIMVGLFIPLGVLVYWFAKSTFLEGVSNIWHSSLGEIFQAGINSLIVSVIAATAAVIIALPLAFWVVRKSKSRFGWLISWLSQSGIALPGVLIALGLSLAFGEIMPRLSFSILAIVLAFVTHFFAQGFQAIRSGLAQISTNLEESSRLLGVSPIRTFWSVIRPLLKPSLLAGWILVFLSSMRELPASLLLRPAGFDTLTVKVWIAASEGFYEEAAQPALMLILLCLPLVFVVLYRQGEQYVHD